MLKQAEGPQQLARAVLDAIAPDAEPKKPNRTNRRKTPPQSLLDGWAG
jgi:hypothetical protein